MLGMSGVCIEEQPRRADHILSLVDVGKINLKSPLRYYGRLADEPKKLPWGAGYNIALSGVDHKGMFVLTLVLQIGMLPLLASEFHRVTFAGTFVNFAAVPWTAIIMPLGFCTLISGLLWPALGKILAGPVSLVTTALLHVVQRFALIQQLSYRLPGPPLWATIIFPITLAGIVTCLRLRFAGRKAMIWSLLSVLAAAGIVIATYPFSPRVPGGRLEVTVLDVGQGDSLFVVSPAGKTLLIDGAARSVDSPAKSRLEEAILARRPSRLICGREGSRKSM
jgi:hypothetical protein